MKKAWENILKSNRGRLDEIEIATTHLYVRFFVTSGDDVELLKADSLELFDYLLDHEIEHYGEYYYDTDVNPDEGKWLYTRVSVDYSFHEIKHEILEELFLYDNDQTGGRTNFSREYYFLLEDESLRITGNLTATNSNEENGRIEALRNPQGSIRVFHTETGTFVPVVGVKVQTRNWFSWGFGYTNENGFYRVNEDYRHDVNYRINFKNISGFRIWNTLVDVDEVSHDGPKTSHEGWDLDIPQGMRSWRFATVNNAAVRYRMHAQQLGIGLPHNDLRIASLDRTGSSAAPMLRRTWGLYGFSTHSQLANYLLATTAISLALNQLALTTKFTQPDLVIASANQLGTTNIYETMFHELAHASHQTKVGSSYWVKYINYIITYGSYGDGSGYRSGLCALGEAWGYHTGYFLTIREFGLQNTVIQIPGIENFIPVNRPSNDDIERFNNGAGTPIFRWTGWIPGGIIHDLIDNNIDIYRPGFSDNAEGFTMQEIFNALDQDVESPQQFRDRLLQETGNKDAADVRNLFEGYFWN